MTGIYGWEKAFENQKMFLDNRIKEVYNFWFNILKDIYQ